MNDTPRGPNVYTEAFTMLTIIVVGNLVSFFEIVNILQYSHQKDKTNTPILLLQGCTIAISGELIHLIACFIYFFRVILKRQIRFYNAMVNLNLALAVIAALARIIAILLSKRDSHGEPDFVNLQTIGLFINVVLCYFVYHWKKTSQTFANSSQESTSDIENGTEDSDLTKNNHVKRKVIQGEAADEQVKSAPINFEQGLEKKNNNIKQIAEVAATKESSITEQKTRATADLEEVNVKV